MTEREDQVVRLGRAYAAWEAWQASADAPSEEEFLAAHEDLRDLLEPMLRGERASDVDGPADRAGSTRNRIATGDRIGPYRILERVGLGGMGEVFVAQQERPVHRRVAIKVLKRGMDSDEIVTRFEAERQALALMNHPNIAQVFDGGMTPDARPYFVMEYVPGRSIVPDCDARRLTTRQRLELFIGVLDAIQHAHHKGVIHRDIKPSNILVHEIDGRWVPKVIDFGIAKAANHLLTDRSLYTRIGQVIGTPEYMSPEQARGGEQDVDTRTDVYSAGAVLYELLTGTVPFEVSERERGSVDGVLRAVCDIDPVRPSTRVTRQDTSSVVAASRGTDPVRLRRQLSGELDWIVLRALEKDRSRRYQTAAAFAADLRAYLENRPVEAGPPTTAYRVRKFVQRYRTQVLASSVVLVALVVGLISSLWLYLDAESAREKEAARAAESRAVTDFLVDLFRAASPNRSLGEEIPVGVLLDEASRRIDRELEEQPAVRGRLLWSIGGAYDALGSFAKAESHLRRAVDALGRAPDADFWGQVAARVDLGNVLRERGDLEEAVRQFRAIRSELADAELGAPPEVLGRVHLGLGLALVASGDGDDAAREVEAGLAILREAHEGEGLDVSYALHTHGVILHRVGRYQEADERFVEAREMLERLQPAGSHGLVMSLVTESRGAVSVGDIERAERTAFRALEMTKRIFGEEHPLLALTHATCAHVLRYQQRLEEAEDHLQIALDVRARLLRAEHPELAWSHNDLATVALELGRTDDAIQHLEQAVRIYRANDPDENSAELATSLSNLANALHEAGRLDEAYEAAQQSMAVAKRSGDRRARLGPASSLGGVLIRMNRLEEAGEILERAALDYAELDPTSEHRPWTSIQLALGRCMQGRGEDAEAAARQALELLGDRDHWHRFTALDLLGWARWAQGDRDDARKFLEEAVAGYSRHPGRGGEMPAYAFDRLAMLLIEEDPARAAELFGRSTEIRQSAIPPSNPMWPRSLENEAYALLACGRAEDASPKIEEALRLRREAGPAAEAAFGLTLSLAVRVDLATGEVDRATDRARENLELQDAAFGAEDLRTAAAVTTLGLCLSTAGRHADAETMLKRALAVQEPRLPAGHPDMLRTLRGLAELCEVQGRNEEAAAWRERMEDR